MEKDPATDLDVNLEQTITDQMQPVNRKHSISTAIKKPAC